jgi:hypothetical protein
VAEKPSYTDLLKHPKWQRKRLEIMQRADFKCEECDNDEVTLNVHHSYYKKDHAPWEYPNESLHCLCENCHERITNIQNRLNRQVRKLSKRYDCLLMLLGYALGIESEIDLDVPIEVFSHDIAVGLADYWSITPRSLMNALQDGIIEPMVLVSYPSLRIIYTDLATIRESTG